MKHIHVLVFVLSLPLILSYQNCSGGFSAFPSSVTQSSSSIGAGTGTTAQITVAIPKAIAGLSYKLSFDEEFKSLSTISNSNIYDGSKWYNGNEQCCMSDTTNNLPGVQFPTVINGLSVNPYSLTSPSGGLNITLSRQNNAWYSGVLTSVDKNGQGFSQKYGYFEMRAKFPATTGTWPAFWMLNTAQLNSQASVGEIDILEQYGQFPDNFCYTLHDWSGGTPGYQDCKIVAPGMETGYHTYGLLWTEKVMSVYYDDVMVSTTSTPAVMNQPYYLLVNLGLGGGWPTGATATPSVMSIQWIHAFAAQN